MRAIHLDDHVDFVRELVTVRHLSDRDIGAMVGRRVGLKWISPDRIRKLRAAHDIPSGPTLRKLHQQELIKRRALDRIALDEKIERLTPQIVKMMRDGITDRAIGEKFELSKHYISKIRRDANIPVSYYSATKYAPDIKKTLNAERAFNEAMRGRKFTDFEFKPTPVIAPRYFAPEAYTLRSGEAMT